MVDVQLTHQGVCFVVESKKRFEWGIEAFDCDVVEEH